MNHTRSHTRRGHRSPLPGPRAGGFTLVEMMVIMAVVGLILMATIPSFARYITSSRLAGATSTLVNDIRYARALANSQHSTYELRRTTEGYSLVRLNPTTTVLTRRMPSGITLSSAGTTSFYSWGLTQPGSITLQQGERSKVVQLTAAGRVTHD